MLINAMEINMLNIILYTASSFLKIVMFSTDIDAQFGHAMLLLDVGPPDA